MIIDVRKLPKEYKNLFVADGCFGLPKALRSPWHDYEERRRRGNKRDFMSNVWGVCVGSADLVFDQVILEKIKNTTIKEPDYCGEIVFSYENGKVVNPKFRVNTGKQRLSWWGPLYGGRPEQNHNYIIAFDISFGLGSSNSVMEIYDCNTQEQVGEWADANTKENDLADYGVATAKWIGGYDPCFMIWENNGGQGSTFRQRILFQQYYNLYTKKKEEAKRRKSSDTYGWRSNSQTKESLLAELGVALSCGINGVENVSSLIIHSKDLLDELNDYIWYENGDAGTSSKQDLKTGAKKRHGDRVISIGLCVLATRDQQKATGIRPVMPSNSSFIERFQNWLNQEEEKQRDNRVWLF